jgi:hypothetical protein
MSSTTIDLVGEAGNRDTQGLGRLVGQYVRSVNLVALLRGLYELGQDMDLLWQKVGRLLNPNDDATQATSNTAGAAGAQLRGIGNVVGVVNVVPGPNGPITLTDAQFLKLILARIYRNHVRGGTVPQLLAAIQIVMPDLTTSDLVKITEIGFMTTMVMIGREVEDWEAGIFAIVSGVSMTKAALMPRPSGVTLAPWWWDVGCFTFATEADQTVLVDETGVGFNTTESFTSGIGRMPEDF